MDSQNITKEFLYMQKLAGVITEAEYNSQVKELDLKSLSKKISEKKELIKKSLQDKGYNI